MQGREGDQHPIDGDAVRAMGHVTTLRIRFNECDPQGHVFHGNYLAFASVASTEFWRDTLGGYDAFTERGVEVLVAELNMRFLAAALFDEHLVITTEVEHLGTTSMGLSHHMAVNGRLVVEMWMRLVCVDVDDHRTVPIPEPVRAALQDGIAHPAELRHDEETL